jgi:hypothetical protein
VAERDLKTSSPSIPTLRSRPPSAVPTNWPNQRFQRLSSFGPSRPRVRPECVPSASPSASPSTTPSPSTFPSTSPSTGSARVLLPVTSRQSYQCLVNSFTKQFPSITPVSAQLECCTKRWSSKIPSAPPVYLSMIPRFLKQVPAPFHGCTELVT